MLNLKFFQNIFLQKLLNAPRLVKQFAVLILDVFFCIFSSWVSFYLRLGEYPNLSLNNNPSFLINSVISILIAIPIFIKNGFYLSIFRFSGLGAIGLLLKTLLLYGLICTLLFTFIGINGIPRTIGIIQPIILFILITSSRIFVSYFLNNIIFYISKFKEKDIVLIYGAGKAGRELASGLINSKNMHVIGYLDDDDKLHGHFLNGLKIFNPENILTIIKQFCVTKILLAIPSVTKTVRTNIILKLSKFNISVHTVPSLGDLLNGKIAISDIRELEIDDLLNRDIIEPDIELLKYNIYKKVVLVTGAGGSIGSELCRQIIKHKPSHLLLVEISESALYQINKEIERELFLDNSHNYEATKLVPLLASVCDEARINLIMQTWKPQTVYHAAAYKHVPLVEHNPAEAILNNVFGTKICAEVALRNDVKNFVLISTDKAVRPTNIMGATKRLSEMVLQALNKSELTANTSSQFNSNLNFRLPTTCFSMVRFGNVLGSSGSVVPLFREQIKNGGPITLTHPDIIRYFMTIPEAAQLVIQSSALGTGGDVFVLDMGKPVKIYNLACRIVELSGLRVKNSENQDGDIEIKIIGLRPGEKLYEELLIGNNPMPTKHNRIYTSNEKFMTWDHLEKHLNNLKLAVIKNDIPCIINILQLLVDGYVPNQGIVDWVHLEMFPINSINN